MFAKNPLLENVPGIEKTATRREKTRLLGAGRVEIKAIVSESCHKNLEDLKNLLSHRNPSMEYGGLLEILSDLALDKYDPRRGKGKRGKKRAEGGQALVSGSGSAGGRKREGKGADLGGSPGGRNENCGVSQPRAVLRSAETSECAGQASAQKSQQTSLIFGASAQKPQRANRSPVTSAQKLRHFSRYIPTAGKLIVAFFDDFRKIGGKTHIQSPLSEPLADDGFSGCLPD